MSKQKRPLVFFETLLKITHHATHACASVCSRARARVRACKRVYACACAPMRVCERTCLHMRGHARAHPRMTLHAPFPLRGKGAELAECRMVKLIRGEEVGVVWTEPETIAKPAADRPTSPRSLSSPSEMMEPRTAFVALAQQPKATEQDSKESWTGPSPTERGQNLADSPP